MPGNPRDPLSPLGPRTPCSPRVPLNPLFPGNPLGPRIPGRPAIKEKRQLSYTWILVLFFVCFPQKGIKELLIYC